MLGTLARATSNALAARPVKTVAVKAGLNPHTTVYKHAIKGQFPAAVKAFKLLLPVTDQEILGKCIQVIGRPGGRESRAAMLATFKLFVEHGYLPSAKLWTSVLQKTQLPPDELGGLVERTGTAWLSDELALVALMDYQSRSGRPDIVEGIFERYQQMLKDDGRNLLPSPSIWSSLIKAAGNAGDVGRAKRYFDRWRRSLAHPYGFMEIEHAYRPPAVPLRGTFSLFNQGLPAPTMPGSSSSGMGNAHNAHVLRSLPLPDPAPYVALLGALAENTLRGNPSSLNLIRLMAADRVPITTSVINSLMHYELCNKEKANLASILALYEKMHMDSRPDLQPNEETFIHVFSAYREPPLDVGRPMPAPLPTQLARHAELPQPSPDLLRGPRKVFGQYLFSLHRPTSRALERALKAFVDTRDFAGAAVLLQLFKACAVEPTPKVHAIVVNGALRAWRRTEGFLRPDSQAWLSSHRSETLLARVKAVSELGGFPKIPPSSTVHTVTIEPVQPVNDSRAAEAYAVSTSSMGSSTRGPEYWNGRQEPRRPWELRATRRYEYRDTAYLFEVLQYASHQGADIAAWQREVDRAVCQMCPPRLQNKIVFDNTSFNSHSPAAA